MYYQLNKKDVQLKNKLVISIPYCKAQYLLYYRSPIGYTDGADIYQIDSNTAISTGYEPFGFDKYFHEYLKTIELESERLVLDNSINIEVKINLLNNKLKDFIDYVKMLIEKDK